MNLLMHVQIIRADGMVVVENMHPIHLVGDVFGHTFTPGCALGEGQQTMTGYKIQIMGSEGVLAAARGKR